MKILSHKTPIIVKTSLSIAIASALNLTSLTANANDASTFASQSLLDIQNTCIVRFNDAISKFDVEGKARGMLTATNAQAKHIYKHSIKGFAVNMNCNSAKTAFANEVGIVSYEQDQPVIAFPGNGNGKKPGGGGEEPTPRQEQITPWGINKVGTQDGTGSTAWILDTGIDVDHPDLNVAPYGFTAFTKGRDANFDDRHGHGTHVAGTVAAKDDGFDVIGVAAGATVVPVKVLDSRGSGSVSGVIAGVDYVAANASAGDCANMSLGGGANDSIDAAVNAAAALGIHFVVAAGNDGRDAQGYSPARATDAITVSAVDSNNNLAGFSNFGAKIDVAAPGVGIISLATGGGVSSAWNGTSMAAPHACGVTLINNAVTKGNDVVGADKDSTNEGIVSL